MRRSNRRGRAEFPSNVFRLPASLRFFFLILLQAFDTVVRNAAETLLTRSCRPVELKPVLAG